MVERKIEPGGVVLVNGLPVRALDVDQQRQVDQRLIRLVLELNHDRVAVLVVEQGGADDLHVLVGLRNDERLRSRGLGAILDDLGLVLARLAGGEGEPRHDRRCHSHEPPSAPPDPPLTHSWVRLAFGAPKTSSASPYSTRSPRYMKPTRSATR